MERKSAGDYFFGKVIGEGSFSTVYIAKESTSGTEYAIKVCDKSTIIKENKTEYVKREKSALHLLNSSPGIISLACTFQDRSKLYFVLTYAANGELLKYIQEKGALGLDCAKFYSAELLLAIEEMHKKNIIHRDLKPENLLLSRDMHLMVADFGSSKILPDDYDYDAVQEEIDQIRAEVENESDSEVPRERRRRRASFVGTAQYVSPEILKGNAAHLSTDLWALGCIIYQMLSGQPPFRGASEYLIFQKILNGEFGFPDEFDAHAKDLVTKLLRFNPKDRLGSLDSKENRYKSIRSEPFFEGINWDDNLYRQQPPEMRLPNSVELESRQEDFNDEPGLGERQLRRILQMEFGSSEESGNNFQTSSSSASLLERMLEEQRAKHEWAVFVHADELILKYGIVNKRKKGLFTRRRMLLLTSYPRLIYIDPNSKIKKGEIPFNKHLTCRAKTFKLFSVHTPNRIYFLEDLGGEALMWCDAIEKAKEKYIKL